jgi:hypothetical protein
LLMICGAVVPLTVDQLDPSPPFARLKLSDTAAACALGCRNGSMRNAMARSSTAPPAGSFLRTLRDRGLPRRDARRNLGTKSELPATMTPATCPYVRRRLLLTWREAQCPHTPPKKGCETTGADPGPMDAQLGGRRQGGTAWPPCGGDARVTSAPAAPSPPLDLAMGKHGFSTRLGTPARRLQAGVPTAFDQPGGTLAVGGSAKGIWRDSRCVSDILYRHDQSDLQF